MNDGVKAPIDFPSTRSITYDALPCVVHRVKAPLEYSVALEL